MSALRHVLVLAGGLSYEREVSLRSGRRVADGLRRAGVETTLRDVDAGLLPALDAERPDAVFIALHGAGGEDGALRGVLDLLGIPYVGADADASRNAWDKAAAKSLLRAAGLPTPDWIALPHETFRELGAQDLLNRIVARMGASLIVKPAEGGSGLGVQPVTSLAELPAAMVGCFGYCDTALIERFVTGVDVAVSVIETADGPMALPAVEIVPADGVYDYSARYTAGSTTWHAPARLDLETAERVAEIAVATHEVLGLRDLSRVDLLVDKGGGVHVLEAAVSPGLTETSLMPTAVQAAGLEFGEVLRDLVEQAIKRGASASVGS
jgi:D-alanine-D-alanine ligase